MVWILNNYVLCSTENLLPFFSLYLQSKPWLAGKMQQQSMDVSLKDYYTLMHLFGENNVIIVVFSQISQFGITSVAGEGQGMR